MNWLLPGMVTAVAAAYFAVALYCFCSGLRARARLARENTAAAGLHDEIVAALADFAAGKNDTTRLKQIVKTHTAPLEDYILRYRASVAGDTRERIYGLMLDLGLVPHWCRQAKSPNTAVRRAALSRLALVAGFEAIRGSAGDAVVNALEDSDREIRLEAARAIVSLGEAENIAEVFRVAISESPLIRAILTPDLRPHALALCETAIPEAFRSTSARHVAAALEIVAAWERALPLPELFPLLHHNDARVRRMALRVLPLASPSEAAKHAAIHAVADASEEVATEAARTVVRLRLLSAADLLAERVRHGRAESARTAAAALALLPGGVDALDAITNDGDSVASSAALEALERTRRSTAGASR